MQTSLSTRSPWRRVAELSLVLWFLLWWIGPGVLVAVIGIDRFTAISMRWIGVLVGTFYVGVSALVLAIIGLERDVRVKELRLIAAVIVIGLIAGISITTVPIGDGSYESWLTAVAILSLIGSAVLLWRWLKANPFWRPPTSLPLRMVLPFGLAVATVLGLFMLWRSRAFDARRLGWAMDGAVVAKQRGDHQSPDIVLRRAGHEIHYRYINDELWERIRVGDHVQKEPWHTDGQLNGHVVRIVPPMAAPWSLRPAAAEPK